jgi:type VI secretion system protein ImpE
MVEISQTAGELFKAGRLAAAVDAANVAVRNVPGDLGARILLAELLIFAGNLDRADKILDAASQIDPTTAVAVAEFRQLLRGEMARRQTRLEGRVPEFLEAPDELERELLAGWVALQAGDLAGAATRFAAAEGARSTVLGASAGAQFEDFRDACDLHSGILEVLTTTGKYFWIPIERVNSIEFHAPARPRDLYWRRATLDVRNGPDGQVYIPALYGTEPGGDESLALGRATEWVEIGEGIVRGVGQRVFLVGDEAPGIMDLETIEFTEHSA